MRSVELGRATIKERENKAVPESFNASLFEVVKLVIAQTQASNRPACRYSRSRAGLAASSKGNLRTDNTPPFI